MRASPTPAAPGMMAPGGSRRGWGQSSHWAAAAAPNEARHPRRACWGLHGGIRAGGRDGIAQRMAEAPRAASSADTGLHHGARGSREAGGCLRPGATARHAAPAIHRVDRLVEAADADAFGHVRVLIARGEGAFARRGWTKAALIEEAAAADSLDTLRGWEVEGRGQMAPDALGHRPRVDLPRQAARLGRHREGGRGRRPQERSRVLAEIFAGLRAIWDVIGGGNAGSRRACIHRFAGARLCYSADAAASGEHPSP